MSTLAVRLTKHAVRRYRERIENCKPIDAADRIEHAVQISRPASARQVHWFTSRNRSRRDKMHGPVLLYCPVESIMLVCYRFPGYMLVKTLLRCPA